MDCLVASSSAASRAKRPPESDGREQRCDQHHEHHRREGALGENRLALQRQRGPDSSEDESHLASRDHTDGDGQAIDAALADAESAGQLAR
jgi:hypothetical protein